MEDYTMKYNKVVIFAVLILTLVSILSGCVTITANEGLVAQITDNTMALEVDEETFEVIKASNKFKEDTSTIYLVTQVESAPEGTKIKAEWYYIDEEVFIASTDIEPIYQSQPLLFSLSKPDNGWPTGKYQVILYINEEKATTVFFTVE